MADILENSDNQESQEWSQDSDNQLLCNLAQTKLNSTDNNNGEHHEDQEEVHPPVPNNDSIQKYDQSSVKAANAQNKMKSGKNEEKKIFVGGVSWDTTEDDLKTFFGQFGEVAHVQIKYDHFTGRSRGFAFVEFADPDGCQKSLQSKEYDLKGKKIEIKPAKSRENKKIFVGGLPGEFTEEELRKHFDQYGRIEEIEWPFDKFQNRRKNFAFIVFEDEDATQKAAAQPKQKFGDRLCDVKIAVPQYMRPQRPYNVPTPYGTGWNEFAGYGAYGSYGGGYGAPTGGYYDDYYANYDYGVAAAHNATAAAAAAASYDYSGWQQGATAAAGYDGWNYSGVPAAGAGTATTAANTSRPARGGYAGYGGY